MAYVNKGFDTLPDPPNQAVEGSTAHVAAPRLSSHHVRALDGLRGLAVLIVILYHCSDYIPGATWLPRLARAALRPGWSGVDLFFVLSGFLITGILLDTRGAPNYFRSFYARRTLRIFPLYYLVLSAILIASHFPHFPNYLLPIKHDRIFYFFYLNNWWPLLKDRWHGNMIGHFWSLAVEEQFYILWSICIFLIKPQIVRRVAAAGIVMALLIRCALYFHSGMTRNLVENTFSRMDALLVGAFLASLVRTPDLLERVRPYAYRLGIASGAAALVLIYLIRNQAWIGTAGLSLLAFAYGAAVLFAFAGAGDGSFAQRVLTDKRLTALGKYSYGMYVYHVPLLTPLHTAFRRFANLKQSPWLGGLLMITELTVTFVVAKLSFDLFESRFLRLKKYFEPQVRNGRSQAGTPLVKAHGAS